MFPPRRTAPRCTSRFDGTWEAAVRTHAEHPGPGRWHLVVGQRPGEVGPAGARRRHARRPGRSSTKTPSPRPTCRTSCVARSTATTPRRALYGLGWSVDGTITSASCGGRIPAPSALGGSTTAVLLPTEQLGVVVLTNTRPIGVPEIIADEIIDQIATGGLTRRLARAVARRSSPMAADRRGPTPPGDPTPAQPTTRTSAPIATTSSATSRSSHRAPGLALDFGEARKTYPLTHFDADTFTFPIFPEEPDDADPGRVHRRHRRHRHLARPRRDRGARQRRPRTGLVSRSSVS